MARPRLDLGEHGAITVTRNASSTTPGSKWLARTRYCTPTTGKVVQKSASGPTQAAARDTLLRRLRDSPTDAVASKNLSVQDAARQWLAYANALGRWQPTTAATYAKVIENNLAALGTLTLAQAFARPQSVRSFVRQTATASNTRGRHVRTVLRQTFVWALQEELVAGSNPVSDIAMPRQESTTPATVALEDIPELLRVADSGPWYISAGVRVLLGSGLRIGELLGLQVQDFDDTRPGAPVVYVRGSVIEAEGRGPIRRHGRAKTSSSLRGLYINEMAAAALRQRLAELGQLQASMPDALLFPARGSKVMSPKNWRRTWRSLREQSVVTREVHPHTLRATYATLAMNRGGQAAEIVASSLGHGGGTAVLYRHYVGTAEIRGVPGGGVDVNQDRSNADAFQREDPLGQKTPRHDSENGFRRGPDDGLRCHDRPFAQRD